VAACRCDSWSGDVTILSEDKMIGATLVLSCVFPRRVAGLKTCSSGSSKSTKTRSERTADAFKLSSNTRWIWSHPCRRRRRQGNSSGSSSDIVIRVEVVEAGDIDSVRRRRPSKTRRRRAAAASIGLCRTASPLTSTSSETTRTPSSPSSRSARRPRSVRVGLNVRSTALDAH